MAMSHEFDRHIEFAKKGNNQQGIVALNALKTQYEIFALAGIVPVLSREQISRSDQLSSLSSNNPSIVTSQQEAPNALTLALKHISEAVRSGSPYVANADTTDKLTHLLPGLTKENLYYWERRGLIHPEMAKRGKKTWRQYSSSEALRVAYIRKCLTEGFSLLSAAGVAGQEVAKFMESQPKEEMRSSLEQEKVLTGRLGRPFYLNIANALHKKIVSGEYSVGAKLPSEEALAEQYSVSRLTLREAVRILVDQGFVLRKRGTGTFVVKKE